jgi:hypothetical protein
MSALAATLAGRRAAERLMVDSCTVRRKTGESRNEDTGAVTPVYGTTVYAGKCRLQLRGLAGQSPDSGEQRIDILRGELQLPISVVGVRVDDRVDFTSSLDPDLVGRVFRVADLMHATHKTARRVPVEEVTG